MNKLIILDRDGVINQDSLEYIKSPDEFILLPGSIEAIKRLNDAGYTIAIATNQSGIARGHYDEAMLHRIHEKLLTHVNRVGGRIACIQYCSHMPDSGCACRKPMPGMLYAIAKQLGCALDGAVMVGDRITDILVARAAGVRPMVVMSQMTDKAQLVEFPEVPIFASLEACVDNLLSVVWQEEPSKT
ncbi:MAG: D-glycero-beta-D-manno-heptose 1,7-bisphosphate 7-phosphatase [Gammaproteobacteria bacterium]|nr:D-glycero-beta-D-manno-heptose 1,7-bisphosphate 7-phosphatase [Gammaproteobacteria bacterium]